MEKILKKKKKEDEYLLVQLEKIEGLKPREQSFADAYCRYYGNVTKACKAIGINKSIYRKMRSANPAFVQALDELNPKDGLIDLAEDKIAERVRKGDFGAIRFVLETLGASRGWTKVTNVAVSQAPSVIIQQDDAAFFAQEVLDVKASNANSTNNKTDGEEENVEKKDV